MTRPRSILTNIVFKMKLFSGCNGSRCGSGGIHPCGDQSTALVPRPILLDDHGFCSSAPGTHAVGGSSASPEDGIGAVHGLGSEANGTGAERGGKSWRRRCQWRRTLLVEGAGRPFRWPWHGRSRRHRRWPASLPSARPRVQFGRKPDMTHSYAHVCRGHSTGRAARRLIS